MPNKTLNSFKPVAFINISPEKKYPFIELNFSNVLKKFFKLNLEQKEILLNHTKKVFEDYFEFIDYKEENFPFEIFQNLIYEKVFVSVYVNNKMLISRVGDETHNILVEIKSAVDKIIENKKFELINPEGKLLNFDIEICIFHNKQIVPLINFKEVQKNIKLGIHAVEIECNNRSAYYKECVAVKHNWTLEKLLEKLSYKAELNPDCFLEPNTMLYKYETQTFRLFNNKVKEIYRHNTLTEQSAVNPQEITRRLSLAAQWFKNNINQNTERLEYEYFPNKVAYSTSMNHVRALATIWSMAQLQNFLNNNSLSNLIETTLNYYLNYAIEGENKEYIYLEVDDKGAKLCYNAFIIMTLIEYEKYSNTDELLNKLGQALLNAQTSNGSFNTVYGLDDITKGIDYYPGEIMLSLIKLYERTKDERYLEAVKKAFPFYRDYWRKNKNTAFVPWHSQTYLILYKYFKSQELSDFVFEMTDWVINNYQILNSKYPDELGGAPKRDPRNCAASWLEGINDAYSLAVQVEDIKHIKKYKESIEKGARFIMQLQFTEDNAFYEMPERLIGGFREAINKNCIRNDFVQHSIMALMKFYKNSF